MDKTTSTADEAATEGASAADEAVASWLRYLPGIALAATRDQSLGRTP